MGTTTLLTCAVTLTIYYVSHPTHTQTLDGRHLLNTTNKPQQAHLFTTQSQKKLFTKVLSLSKFYQLVKMTLDQELQGHAAHDYLRGECKVKASTGQIISTSHANCIEHLDDIQETQQWSDEALD